MTIEWPNEWSREEGWPTYRGRGERAIGCDFTWRSLNRQLRQKHGSLLTQRVEALGGPPAQEHQRTLDQVIADVQAFFAREGRRPRSNDPNWGAVNQWLRGRGSSLEAVCDELGLPGARVRRSLELIQQATLDYYQEHQKRPRGSDYTTEWGAHDDWLRSNTTFTLTTLCDHLGLPRYEDFDLESVRSDVLEFYKDTGRRPSPRVSDNWRLIGNWLTRQGQSLPELCDDLGLPRVCRSRTLDQVKAEVKAYFQTNGKRPTPSVMGSTNAWLMKNHGTSISLLCDDLGMPKLNVRGRTMEEVREKILAFFKEHGRRPTGRKWAAVGSWLKLQGTTLSQLCDQLGLPGFFERGRSLDTLEALIIEHFVATGSRPTARTSKDWRRWADWVKHNHQVTLPGVCDDLGLPPIVDLTRTWESVERRAREHFAETGQRPTSAQTWWCGTNQWLKRAHSVSLPEFLDRIGLPAKLEPLPDDIDAAIREHFEQHGKRPTQRTSVTWRRINDALKPASSISRRCDDLGLPPLRKFDRTIEDVEQMVQEHLQRFGRAPTEKLSKEWNTTAAWLRARGMRLSDVAGKFGGGFISAGPKRTERHEHPMA